MRLYATKTAREVFFLGFIKADELTTENMRFLIDTGSVSTVISGYEINQSIDYKTLSRGKGSYGIGGFQKTYLLHNIYLFLYDVKGREYKFIKKFPEMDLVPPIYDTLEGSTFPIPCVLGMDIIGHDFRLVCGKRSVYIEN